MVPLYYILLCPCLDHLCGKELRAVHSVSIVNVYHCVCVCVFPFGFCLVLRVGYVFFIVLAPDHCLYLL